MTSEAFRILSAMSEGGLSELPPVDGLICHPRVELLAARFGRDAALAWTRTAVDELRQSLRTGTVATRADLTERAIIRIENFAADERVGRLHRVINATGVVLHTNLGRAPLSNRALMAIEAAGRSSNVEMDLAAGARRYRGHQLDLHWQRLTGAEASLVVNNCAAATVLALQALATGREVIVSRGQLIEIGGSYRLPDICRLSGAVLREVGTTNRTRLADYRRAIGPDTAAILRVHPSNFRVVGFTEEVDARSLAALAHELGLPMLDDIGSGCLVDLRPHGLLDEPIVSASLAADADVVLFSGDKLLGGPQCGVALGKRLFIDRMRESPLARAVRVDKLTLAALQATLEIYSSGQPFAEIPVLRLLTATADGLQRRANSVAGSLGQIPGWTVSVGAGVAAVGGGSLATAELPTWMVAVESAHESAVALMTRWRRSEPAVVGRLVDDAAILDLRSVLPEEDGLLVAAVRAT